MHSLSTIGLCNGEYAEVQNLMLFLKWMRGESAPIPETGEEMDALLTRWTLFVRRCQMERLRDDGKISQAAFKRMTKRGFHNA